MSDSTPAELEAKLKAELEVATKDVCNQLKSQNRFIHIDSNGGRIGSIGWYNSFNSNPGRAQLFTKGWVSDLTFSYARRLFGIC